MHSDSVNQAIMQYTLHLVWVTHPEERVDSVFQFQLNFAMMASAKTDLIQSRTYTSHSTQSIWVEVNCIQVSFPLELGTNTSYEALPGTSFVYQDRSLFDSEVFFEWKHHFILVVRIVANRLRRTQQSHA
jgi:hypothetical protein